MESIEEYLKSVDRPAFVPGCEPFFYEHGDVGCLLLHGWAGSCDEFRFVGPELAAAGITVYCPSLPGHGTSAQDMARTDARDWAQSATRHLQLLAERCRATFVAGQSMGGMLTMYLGATQGHLLSGIVPINGGVSLNNPEMAQMALARDAPEWVPIFDAPEANIKDTRIVPVVYQERPTNSLLSLMGLAKITEELLPLITAPTLIIQARHDGAVPPINGQIFHDRISSTDKRILWLENSYHAATLDFDRALLIRALVGFIREHS
jgi:carboxylesterase